MYLRYGWYPCDISHIALAEAQAADKTGKIDYKLGDALDLPYEDNSFDIVLLFDVFEHVTDVGKAADERAEGLAVAVDLCEELRARVAGLYLIPPFRRYDHAAELIELVRS